jgi:hypothetical protein
MEKPQMNSQWRTTLLDRIILQAGTLPLALYLTDELFKEHCTDLECPSGVKMGTQIGAYRATQTSSNANPYMSKLMIDIGILLSYSYRFGLDPPPALRLRFPKFEFAAVTTPIPQTDIVPHSEPHIQMLSSTLAEGDRLWVFGDYSGVRARCVTGTGKHIEFPHDNHLPC